MVLIWVEWFQHGSHSQNRALSLPSLSFISSCFFFFLPLLTFLSLLTSHPPLYFFICRHLLFLYLTLWQCNCLIPGLTWDLHTWEWVAAKKGGRRPSHFPGFIPELWGGGGMWGYMREERRSEEWETSSPQTLAEGSSFTCQGYTRAECPGHLLYQRCGSTCIGYKQILL